METSNDKISGDSESEWIYLTPSKTRKIMEGQALEMRVRNFIWDAIVLRCSLEIVVIIQI